MAEHGGIGGFEQEHSDVELLDPAHVLNAPVHVLVPAANDEQSLRVAAYAIAVAKVCEATELRGVS